LAWGRAGQRCDLSSHQPAAFQSPCGTLPAMTGLRWLALIAGLLGLGGGLLALRLVGWLGRALGETLEEGTREPF